MVEPKVTVENVGVQGISKITVSAEDQGQLISLWFTFKTSDMESEKYKTILANTKASIEFVLGITPETRRHQYPNIVKEIPKTIHPEFEL